MADVSVLRVERDETDRTTPVAGLTDEPNVRVYHRETLADARQLLAERDVDCLVTEYVLPDGTGMELIAHVREVAPDTGCILCTDADREQIADDPTTEVAEYVRKDSPAAETRIAQLVQTTAEQRSQTSYPVPGAEDERVAALTEYDVDSELFLGAVQRIADLAAEHFDVQQSSVNLVTEHTQEFLACHGEQWSPTSREDSVCAYAIISDGVTVVEDTRADPRFEGNEVLRELGVRFYAGATLTTDDGLSVGTVCIYDDRPREFDAEDEAYLERLAEEAQDWLTALGRLEDAEGEETAETATGGDR